MRKFRTYDPNQQFLLPPDLRSWLNEGHLALFISDVVDTLDLSEIYSVYRKGDGRGQPPYHPAMMVKVLLYAYVVGMPSSRKIEKATWEDIAFRVLSANQQPDHDSIANFRKQHLQSLSRLFLQVLKLCQAAGLVKLGHIAIDGTKVKANASKHKAMSYSYMCEKDKILEEEIKSLLTQAEAIDQMEDQKYGKGNRGDELPAELARRETRLKKIQEAKASLEAEARQKAEEKEKEAKEKIEKRKDQEAETGKKAKGRSPTVPIPAEAKPEPKAQRNFTDPESRIMLSGATKSFEQAYNSQIAVDSANQIIVATGVTQKANDKNQLIPILLKTKDNVGSEPKNVSADAGYFSESNLTDPRINSSLHIPPEKQRHGQGDDKLPESPSTSKSVKEQMREKLKTPDGKELYKMRKAIVEPVFGQIKEDRGFRRFSFRGLLNVAAEWDLICLTHNILKLFRYGGGKTQPVGA